MVFASYTFLFGFLCLVLVTYYAVPRKGRELVLTLFSYLFYGWWRPDFVLLMAFSTIIDYRVGRAIHEADNPRRRRRFLIVSLVVNLGLLAYFKYWNFGIDNLNAILAGFGVDGPTWPSIILPVGISFYTFQTMSYSLDIYRGVARPLRNPIDFACYVSLFPQLVAGPIVRYNTLEEQLRNRVHSLEKFGRGVRLFEIGFAKKILIADSLAPIADGAFAAESPGFAMTWIGLLAYTFQIYYDFSGYSDMAIGLGRMFGFEFPVNFDSPYKSKSVTEFWRRWHISLSTWLRDYLYIPLGGNRLGSVRTYVNLGLTMLLGGLWHGAAWNFVAWGAYQGLWLSFERALGKRSLYGALPAIVRIAITFVITMIGWLLFRGESMEQIGVMARAMVIPEATDVTTVFDDIGRLGLAAFAVAILVTWGSRNSQELDERNAVWLSPLATTLFLVAVGRMFFQDQIPFLYFQF